MRGLSVFFLVVFFLWIPFNVTQTENDIHKTRGKRAEFYTKLSIVKLKVKINGLKYVIKYMYIFNVLYNIYVVYVQCYKVFSVMSWKFIWSLYDLKIELLVAF